MKVQNLLVDLDGTLLGASEIRVQLEFFKSFVTWWGLRQSKNGKWKAVQALRELKRAIVDSKPTSSTNETKGAAAISSVFGLKDTEALDLITQCIDEIFPKLEPHFFPLPGAVDFLDWAHAHYPLFLATNPVWSEKIVTLRVKWAGINPKLFQSLTHAGKMKACKPRPEYYQEILEQENLTASSCLLIGNDMRNDAPAVNVGITVVILSTNFPIKKAHHRKLKTSGPDGRHLLWKGNFKAIRKALEENFFDQSK